MDKIKEDVRRFYASQTAIHSCLVGSVILLNLLWWLSTSKPISFLTYVGVLIVLHLSGLYSGRWLYKKYFLWANIWRFIGYVFAAVLLISLAGLLLFALIDEPYYVKYLFISFVNAFPAILLGIFITLIRGTLQMQISEARNARQQKESELSLLHSQLSPHFLFNTLNNLYSMSLVSDKRISQILLKLSELLRYSLYETKNNYVPLSNEIEYINNYIELEKIRIGDRLVLTHKIESDDVDGVMIAPMIVIVFLENAFKHSKNTYNEKIFIEFFLKVTDKKIYITIKNSYDETVDSTAIIYDSGIGISNATKRLQLLYPGNYQLKPTLDKGFYNVDLILDTK
jgi:sensor histidine kinase YesM